METSDGQEEGRAETLVVWSARPEETKALFDSLESCREIKRVSTLPDPSGTKSTDHLLLCDGPVTSMGRMMAAGMSPDKALAVWSEQAAALLALHRSSRRRVHLVEIRAALQDPAILPVRPVSMPSPPSDDSDGPDPVFLVLAQHCLERDGRAQALAAEMAAAMAGSDMDGIDLETAFSAYRTTRKRADRSERETARLEQEIRLLKAQNRAAQEEMEALSHSRIKLRSDWEAAQREVELLQKQISAMREELALLEREREQLHQRLFQLDQGMESQEQQIAKLEGERDRLKRRLAGKDGVLTAAERQIEALRQELDGMFRVNAQLRERKAALAHRSDMLETQIRDMENSRSWRLTAPLRRIRRLLSPER